MTVANAKTTITQDSVERHIDKLTKLWKAGMQSSKDPEVQVSKSPYNKPHSKLKRSVYTLVKKCVEHNLIHVIEKRVMLQHENSGTFKPSDSNKKNPFYWGLLAVCTKRNPLPRSNLHRFALELQYANMHDVPVHFLIGFIYQIGTSEGLQDKIRNSIMQPWFKDGQNKPLSENKSKKQRSD